MGERKNAGQEFVPKVIEDGSDDEPYFFAAIPQQIDANDNYDPALIGFPLNIPFGGIRYDLQTGEESPVHVCYEPAPETFHENSEQKEMRYFPKARNSYSIRVIFEKKASKWRTEKLKGSQVIRTACGSTFDQVMIHTTMGGSEPDGLLAENTFDQSITPS